MKFFVFAFGLILGSALAKPFNNYSNVNYGQRTQKNSYQGTNQWGTQYQPPSSYSYPSAGHQQVRVTPSPIGWRTPPPPQIGWNVPKPAPSGQIGWNVPPQAPPSIGWNVPSSNDDYDDRYAGMTPVHEPIIVPVKATLLYNQRPQQTSYQSYRPVNRYGK